MYFKVLRSDLAHYGFTYHEGLNELTSTFDPKPIRSGGLFFTDKMNLFWFLHRGTQIAEVILPETESIIVVGCEYKAHSIILGPIKDLWTTETFRWLKGCGINLHSYNDYILQYAAENDYLDIVKYLVEQGADIHAYDDCTLRLAAVNGHLDVVEYLGSLERDN